VAFRSLLFLGNSVSLRNERVELRLLIGYPVGIAIFVLGTGIAGGLLNELAEVVTKNLNTLFKLGKVFDVGHDRSCSF
jgi:hypothetical protein